MGHSDGVSMGMEPPKQSHSQPRPTNDKLTYRLFPTANQQPQVSPRTLQQQTLQRNGSFNKRRSASLDDSHRPHGVARMPFSRPGDAPVPRLQKVPANRMKVSKATQERTCTSNGHHLDTNADGSEAVAPSILLYKPRVSEDGGHGRSSSAPDDMRAEIRPKKPTGLANMTYAVLHSSARAVRGGGGTWYNPHDSTIEPSTSRYDKRDPQLEKPLPLPPKDTNSPPTLDPYHNRSHSTPLSPGPRSNFYTGARADSVTELTPLVTPSSLDPSRKSYFPLSSDAQMRKLMGFSPIEDDEKASAAFPTRGDSKGLGAPLLLPSSRYQRPADPPIVTARKESRDEQNSDNRHRNSPESLHPASAQTERKSAIRPSPPSPTFSQASKVPPALRIKSPKRSVSVSASLDRRVPALDTRLRTANDMQPPSNSAETPAAKDERIAKALSVLSELTTQTDNLHSRYASLREDRQMLLSTITQGLREQKAGPDYVNTIFDHHMSLATICSSMDICLAKLKAVARRKDALIKELANPAQPKQPLPSIGEQKGSPVITSARSTPAIPSSHKMSLSTPSSLQLQRFNSTRETSRPTPSDAMRRFHSKLDIEYDTDDSEAPRRMNIKGAKAAKILGLAMEPSETRSSESTSTRPTHNLQANHSTTSLDRELFTRPLSPAPERPLPTRPYNRMKARDHTPTPLPLKPTEKAVVEKTSHTAQNSVGDSTISSRASSPAEERGAETPHEEHPAFDAKSPGMQTVHVYFPESTSAGASLHSSTWSEVGEDELLEYYGYLR